MCSCRCSCCCSYPCCCRLDGGGGGGQCGCGGALLLLRLVAVAGGGLLDGGSFIVGLLAQSGPFLFAGLLHAAPEGSGRTRDVLANLVTDKRCDRVDARAGAGVAVGSLGDGAQQAWKG